MLPTARWPGGTARFVAVEGGAVAVETIGTGPPLLMLHGWTLDRRMWLLQMPLAQRFTLIGVDRRGFGQSTAPPDLAAEPDDILRVADALGQGRFHLLGMSQGGRVALALARQAPDRLLSLILQGAPLDGVAGDDEAVPFETMVAAAQRDDLRELRALWQGHRLMAAVTAEGRSIVAAMLADYTARDLAAPPRALPAGPGDAARAPFPVYAIVGQADTEQRLANARVLGKIGAAVSVIRGGGHLCNMDRPQDFNALIVAVLAIAKPQALTVATG